MRLMMALRKVSPREMKSIQTDVQLVVDHLVDMLGGSWAVALVPRAPKDSLLVNPPKSPRPWEAVERLARSPDYGDWIRGHLDSKVTWM